MSKIVTKVDDDKSEKRNMRLKRKENGGEVRNYQC